MDSFIDSDTKANNTTEYFLAKGRTEFEKRGESINDPDNHDVHMGKLVCADCHYPYAGDINPLVDKNNNTIQPGLVGVKRIDHQFVKGNNQVDGNDMDQFDNTLTCKKCHWTFDHPSVVNNGDGTYSFRLKYIDDGNGNSIENLGPDGLWNTGDEQTVPLPKPTHPAFPAFHFYRIDCRTCHIPKINFVKKQLATDYSTAPYPEVGVERGQNIYKEVFGEPKGIGYRPFYIWMDKGHEDDEFLLTPVTIGSIFMWKNLNTNLTYAERFPSAAAKKYRDSTNPVFTINSPQGAPADEALIANTTSEVNGMVTCITIPGNRIKNK